MPTYDYRCTANGRVIEINHKMSDDIATWGELCGRAGIDPGDTPRESPVARLATGGQVITHGHSDKGREMPACASGGCCAGGMCGIE